MARGSSHSSSHVNWKPHIARCSNKMGKIDENVKKKRLLAGVSALCSVYRCTFLYSITLLFDIEKRKREKNELSFVFMSTYIHSSEEKPFNVTLIKRANLQLLWLKNGQLDCVMSMYRSCCGQKIFVCSVKVVLINHSKLHYLQTLLDPTLHYFHDHDQLKWMNQF